MVFTFKRGIHPNEEKQHTENIPINTLLTAAGTEAVFPLVQHIGAPCEPLVKVGQKVLLGEKIGDSEAFMCAPVHTSMSGVVKDIRPHLTVLGTIVNSIIIENDGEYTEHESIQLRDDAAVAKLTREDLLTIIREAGIVGLGGAAFPTHVKLNPPPDKKVDTLLINGCECEPYLTTDNRVMIEESDRIVLGLQLMQRILPEAKGIIAIEDNKPEAIAAMRRACEGVSDMDVAVVKTKYPQGAEKQLISAVLNREVPSGKLPVDAGVIVNNVDTVIAIHRAVYRGRPLMRKVVTLTGSAIKNPGNYKARVGMKLGDLVEMIGGFNFAPSKIVMGGPMMGAAIFDINVPILKATSGILFLSEEEAYYPPERNCIRCGSCVEHCPAGLIPIELNIDVMRERWDDFRKHNGIECIVCGSCSYICPSKRRLAQSIGTIRRVELEKMKNEKK